MVSMTLAIPKELKKDMELYPEINWSEVARAAIKRKIQILKEMNRLLANSTFTEEDAIIFGHKVTKKVAKKFERV
jgi:hypothetical protein